MWELERHGEVANNAASMAPECCHCGAAARLASYGSERRCSCGCRVGADTKSTRRGSRGGWGASGAAVKAVAAVSLLLLALPAAHATCEPDHFVELVCPGDGDTVSQGGTPFSQQPVLMVVDANGDRCLALDGTTVSVNLGQNPLGRGTCIGPDFASIVIDDGFANFTGLSVDIAAAAYTLRYWGETMTLESCEFDVEVGPPVQLVITQQPGSITGGELFKPQPVLEIQDAGGNPWPDENDARIAVSIENNPPGDGQLLYSHVPLGQDHFGPWQRARCSAGVCPFEGLSIDKAGVDYTLRFDLEEGDHGLTGADLSVVSDEFTVGVGPTAYLEVTQQPDGARGGETFLTQPQVTLYDSGGNVQVHDSTSRVTVTIQENPSAGTLLPFWTREVLPGTATVSDGSPYVQTTFDADEYLNEGDWVEIGEPDLQVHTETVDTPYDQLTEFPDARQIRIVPDTTRFRLQNDWDGDDASGLTVTVLRQAKTVQVENGVADFSDLRLDKAGNNYVLRFEVSHLQPTHAYTEPGVYVDSDPFDVTYGEPAQLAIVQPAGEAWAGGQPFGQQPIVHIQDAGGNTLDDIDDVIIVQVTCDNCEDREATLLGNVTVREVLGVAEFQDLHIDVRGSDYNLVFNTTIGDFTQSQLLHVLYSSEWEVRNSDNYKLDNYGQAVDVDGDWAIVGAHKEDRRVKEVQTVSTVGTSAVHVHEIQQITTYAEWEPMVQVVTTSADADETIGGEFYLSFSGAPDYTDALPFDAYAELVKVHLENDIDGTGEVDVTREDNTACGCTGGYIWSITFRHLEGAQPTMTTLAALTGTNAAASVSVAVPSVTIGGDFTLTIPEGPLTGGELTTRLIPHDSRSDWVEMVLSEDLKVGNVGVTRTEEPDAQGGYTWSVTFDATHSAYDVPEMIPDSSGLTGNGATAAVNTRREGKAPLGGNFQLYFRGDGPTASLAFDASAQDMVDALEDLNTIDSVTVERSGPVILDDGDFNGEPDSVRGYVWTITFDQVRHLTDETESPRNGFVMDPLHINLEGLTVETSEPYVWRASDVTTVRPAMLTGTGAHVEIDKLYNVPEADDYPWDPIVQGQPGEEAGAAYILTRSSAEAWTEFQKLRGVDTGAYNQFGFSVAMDGTSVIVGAPGALDPGVLEQQRLVCTADAGTFTLTWRTHTTAALDFDATADELKAALEDLPTIHEVSVDTSGSASDAVCDGAGFTTVITFVFPQDGDLEPLVADASSLLDGVGAGSLVVEDDFVQGTRKPHGTDSSDKNVGAAYVFVYNAGDEVWEEQAKLMDEATERELGDSMGFDVSISAERAAVGVPYDTNTGVDSDEDAMRSGSVLIFSRDGTDWTLEQRLVPREREVDAHFGHSVSLYENTVVISAPGYDGGQGRVYVFKHNPVNTRVRYMEHQTFDAPTSPALPVAGFGADVSIMDDVMVAGAPGARDSDGVVSGLAYVYDREAEGTKFFFRQTLRPTPALSFERVGITVEVDDDRIAIGSLALYNGPTLGAESEVMLIRTRADTTDDNVIGNTFQLGWRRDNDGQLIKTRPIESDASAADMRRILQEDLNVGDITVRRHYPTAQQGYRWFVTFHDKPELRHSCDVDYPLFTPFSDELTGDGARVDVEYVNKAPPEIPGQVYIYTRPGAFGDTWQEQGVLTPYRHQPADLFGSALGLGGSTAIVGAPNRDLFASGSHSGAVFLFDLAILNVRFENLAYDIDEDVGTATINILRCDPECRVAATPQLLDDGQQEQLFMWSTYDGNDWGIYRFPPTHSHAPADERSFAVGRTDCRHPYSASTDDCLWSPSNSHAWTKSAYDFGATSDYSPLHEEVTIASDGVLPTTHAHDLIITNDKILEQPDEAMHIRLWAPGFQPTLNGDHWTTVTIVDDGDGGQGTRSYYEKLFGADEAADVVPEAAFGASVAMDGGVLLVSAPEEEVDSQPHAGSVHAFSRTSGIWSREGVLPTTATENARFGSGIALDNNVAAVASVGLISVAFYTRTPGSPGSWALDAELQPVSDAPYADIRPMHQFGSWHSVAISEGPDRFAAVGAHNLESVFVFRDPDRDGTSWVQSAMIRASHWRDMLWLQHYHMFRQSFGAALAISGTTLVIGAPTGNYESGELAEPTTWTGVQELDSHAEGRGLGRVYMYELSSESSHDSHYVDDSVSGIWVEHAFMSGSDGRARDRFGAAVAIDGDQVAVGAWGCPGEPRVTWDFETGDLRGWSTTGYAFLEQPTWGDNTAARTPEGPPGTQPQSAGHRGRFWVGTAEARPMNPAGITEEPEVAAGTAAGDAQQGTLTSDPFRIAGTTISLLVGGGCDQRLEYVELLVDGAPSVRATGGCKETMQRVHWDVSYHIGRTAQIRVVDASSARWGHINIDDIRFSWDMQGYTETPVAGAVYTIRRKAAGTEEPCAATDKLDCEWEHQSKLVAGDKRPGVRFGWSIDVDVTTETLVVGAPLQHDTRPDRTAPGSAIDARIGDFGDGFSFRADGGVNIGDVGGLQRTLWGTDISPYLRNTGTSHGGQANMLGIPSVGQLNLDRSALGGSGKMGTTGRMFSDKQESSGINSNLAWDRGNPHSGLPAGIGPQTRADVSHPDSPSEGGVGPWAAAGAIGAPQGAVYVFRRVPEIRDGFGRLLFEPHWPVSQHAILEMPGAKYNDYLGADIAVDGFDAVVGAPRDATMQNRAGSASLFDTEFQRVYFEFEEYVVVENYHFKRISIRVMREGDLSGYLDVAYSTRDITAYGMNQTVAQYCVDTYNLAHRTLVNAGYDEWYPEACGDYTQASGVLHFLPTESYQTFFVDIMDDWCDEPEPERFMVQLATPGEIPLRGEGYTAVVRIDDDDQGLTNCQVPLRDNILT